ITYIVDEIDQSLHPALLYKLIQKIMADTETKGQLIFTTHDSNLLDLNIFRQDEIWFAEKDKMKGSTQLYSLNEYKPRYDLDIRKGYLKGRFGAIPFLANLDELNWHDHGA
ncbi:MAG: AAA family ATPase, partial [Taibaiella sp.]|nr:AAA family ATPase [Taibaiella sp.]